MVVLVGLATLLLGHRLGVVGSVEPRVRSGWLALHALAFAVFWLVSARMLGGSEPPAGPAAVWLAVWLSLGVGSTAALLLGLFRVTRRELRALARVLLFAAPAGLLAWAAGEGFARTRLLLPKL